MIYYINVGLILIISIIFISLRLNNPTLIIKYIITYISSFLVPQHLTGTGRREPQF